MTHPMHCYARVPVDVIMCSPLREKTFGLWANDCFKQSMTGNDKNNKENRRRYEEIIGGVLFSPASNVFDTLG